MSRVKIPADLHNQLLAFQRAKGLTEGEIGEILNVDTSVEGLSWIHSVNVPEYVVEAIRRLVATERFEGLQPCEAVAAIAVRFGLAEKVEVLTFGRGVVLFSGYAVDGSQIQVMIPARSYGPAMLRGDAETWRHLRTYVAGYVAACLETKKLKTVAA